jgi:hypothetical protein
MGPRNPEKSRPFISLCKLVIFILVCLIFVLNGCQRDSKSRPETAAPSPQTSVASERKQTLPHCPEAPYPMLQAKDPATGHHRVFLKWNASTSASGSNSKELGYCLYRTQKPGRAKDCPKNYPKCEQVNVVPVSGTRCVDELVKDNSTYYYVAIAITSTDTSTTSEEAIAEVPAAGKQNPPPPGADSYPSCRVPVASSQPTGR